MTAVYGKEEFEPIGNLATSYFQPSRRWRKLEYALAPFVQMRAAFAVSDVVAGCRMLPAAISRQP